MRGRGQVAARLVVVLCLHHPSKVDGQAVPRGSEVSCMLSGTGDKGRQPARLMRLLPGRGVHDACQLHYIAFLDQPGRHVGGTVTRCTCLKLLHSC